MALAPDPDLAPVPRPPEAEPAAAAPTRRRPRIEPAEPADWSGQVALRHPLLVDGERLERLALRRLTGRDIADLLIEDDDEATLNLRARALAAGVHWSVLEALSADDAEATARAIGPFLPAALAALEEQAETEADAAA